MNQLPTSFRVRYSNILNKIVIAIEIQYQNLTITNEKLLDREEVEILISNLILLKNLFSE